MNEILEFLRREIVGTWRYRWWAMLVAWVLCALGWVAVFSMPSLYEANAKFFVETQSRLDRVIGSVVVEDQVGGQVNLVKQALLGRPVLEKVAEDTDLILRAATPLQKNDLITSLSQKIVVTGSPGVERMPRPDDGIYTIAFRDKDRLMSLSVVNSLLNQFMDDVVRGRQSSSEETIAFLRSEISKYDDQLRQRERELADFKQENVGLLPGEGIGYFDRMQVELDELSVLEAQLENAVSRRAALEAQLQGANPFGSGGAGSSVAGTAPRTDLDGQIMDLETTLGEMLLRFTERHPDVVATQEQLEQLKARRRNMLEMMRNASGENRSVLSSNPVYQELNIALNEIDVEIASLQSQLSRERSQIADLRNKVDVIPAIEAQLTELTRDYDQVKTTYDELRKLLEQEVIASRKQEAAVVNFRLIDPPYVGTEPVSPRRELLLAAVFVMSLGAGAALAWLLHLMRPVFYDVADLKQSTGLPVLGAVSVAWADRGRVRHRLELTTYALTGCVLVAAFVAAFLFRDPATLMVRNFFS